MARRKKKKGRSRAGALSPINKQGIKLGTLLSEVGVGLAGYKAWEQRGTDPGNIAGTLYKNLFELDRWPAKLLWSGVGIALIGRFTGFRKFGILQLS